MDKFEDVTVVKKASVYYDGQVTSRTVLFKDGSRKTLGIFLPGHYEFKTGDREHMEILMGSVNVLLPESSTWTVYKDGQSFDVPANSSFNVSVDQVVDYCCSYTKE